MKLSIFFLMKLSTILLRSLLLIALLAIAACNSDDDDDHGHEHIDESSILSGSSTLTTTDESISGTGSVIFTDSLGAVASGKRFHVEASLDAGDSFTIHAYSNNQLANGVDLIVTRPINTPTSLEVTLDGNDVSGSFTNIAADEDIIIVMDIHNNENPSHVLIWSGDVDHLEEDDAIVNSEDSSLVDNQGAGAFWGLTLAGAEVTEAKAEEASEDHDH